MSRPYVNNRRVIILAMRAEHTLNADRTTTTTGTATVEYLDTGEVETVTLSAIHHA